MSAKPPPPRPECVGSTTANANAAATAASTALPPRLRIDRAAELAVGWAVATTPPRNGRAANADALAASESATTQYWVRPSLEVGVRAAFERMLKRRRMFEPELKR